MNSQQVGQFVRRRRTALGLTQTDLANLCKTMVPQISNIENGIRNVPRAKVHLFAKALKVKPDDLTSDTRGIPEGLPRFANYCPYCGEDLRHHCKAPTSPAAETGK